MLDKYIAVDYDKIVSQHGRIFLWTTFKFYTPVQAMYVRYVQDYLERIAGPFDDPVGAVPVVETRA